MRSSTILSWFVALILLSFTFNNFSQARYLKKLNSVVVVGTIYCDICIQEDLSKTRHFISGALVAVECENEKSKLPTFRDETKTNDNGEFKVHLPFSVPKNTKQIKGCSVQLLKRNEPFCTVASSTISSIIFHFESSKQGAHVYSAGLFTFKPSNQPDLCNKKPKKELKLLQSPQDVSFPPPINDPEVPFIPPIPDLPQIPTLPTLPPLPPTPKIPTLPPKTADLLVSEIGDTVGKNIIPQIPFVPSPPSVFGIPFPPNPLQPPSIFPPFPNPFQPPPSVFPPINFPPLIPSPPPVFPIPLPPNPFQPPPSIFPPINFPPLVPVLIPSPPPPPPAFLIPLPPFPFPPAPVFPGFPPSSNKASP